MAKKSTTTRTRKKKVIKNTINFNSIDSQHFINRELSWLEFNDRVLFQALDDRNPILERVRFLGIYNSNLDEFYMKRVGELKRKIEVNPNLQTINGFTLIEEFEVIRKKIMELNQKLVQTYLGPVKEELARNNIILLNWSDLSKEELKSANSFFRDNLFPILTPLAVDLSHPFPFISNLSTSLGVCLKKPGDEEKLFARIKIPKMIPQWILLYDNKEFKNFRFVSIIEIIKNNLVLLFPGMEIIATMIFRITRNADWDPEDENSDLIKQIEDAIKDRKFAECIRLEYQGAKDEWMISLLKDVLELKDEDLYQTDGLLDYTDLKVLLDLEMPQLKFKQWNPVIPLFVHDEPTHFFQEIKKHDILVHHPYESFTASVEKFIKMASTDPHVLAIKMTLYRTGDNSMFVKHLIRAAEMQKQVVCIVELRARFDEERNIFWAQELEKAGVHVVYGVVGYKTHTKTALVIRRESDNNLCAYAHIGTGNYHSQTSNLYTDLGMFTTNKEITDELTQLFHYLTGLSLNTPYKNLLVAPFNMKQRFLEMIEREISFAKEGKDAVIIAKMNSLEDVEITEKLYLASQSGVKITLIVRGFCCLKPQTPGLSENIHVISIVGRFLEHSRLFYFKNGKEHSHEGDFFFGSADWMYRNLNNRVEVITPVLSKDLKLRLWDYIEIMLKDHRLAWDMQADGSYKLRKSKNEKETSTHELLMHKAVESSIPKPR